MKKIVFTGGGSAGHITPNLAIIDQLKNYKIYYFGSNGMEKELLSKYKNIEFIEIPSVKLIRKLTLKNLQIPFKLIKSISMAQNKKEVTEEDIQKAYETLGLTPEVEAAAQEEVQKGEDQPDIQKGEGEETEEKETAAEKKEDEPKEKKELKLLLYKLHQC